MIKRGGGGAGLYEAAYGILLYCTHVFRTRNLS